MTITSPPTETDSDHIAYFRSRWKYTRPNLITLADNAGKYYVSGEDKVWLPAGVEGENYIFLSDHNRSSANFTTERIGDRKRMINGTMRSYYIAAKVTLPLTWDSIPSRAFSHHEGYKWWVDNKDTCAMFTVDGGAGGANMLDWWQQHVGSMWAFISIDNNVDPALKDQQFINGYSKVYEVMMTDFSYDVKNRSRRVIGADVYLFDLWDVSMTLEEV